MTGRKLAAPLPLLLRPARPLLLHPDPRCSNPTHINAVSERGRGIAVRKGEGGVGQRRREGRRGQGGVVSKGGTQGSGCGDAEY